MELNDSSISYLANLILVVKQQRSDDVSALAALRRIHFMVYVPYVLQNRLFFIDFFPIAIDKSTYHHEFFRQR